MKNKKYIQKKSWVPFYFHCAVVSLKTFFLGGGRSDVNQQKHTKNLKLKLTRSHVSMMTTVTIIRLFQ